MPDPAAQRPDQPFRAELLSLERLTAEARDLATTQDARVQERPATIPLLPLLEVAAAALAADNVELAAFSREQRAVSPAAEWLLDNYYLIEEQVLAVRRDLPTDYGVELPRLQSGALEGYPRVYEVACDLLSHTDSRLDDEALHAFVEGFQEVDTLTIGEAWAIPIMLRVALVENLRRLSRAVVDALRAERSADAIAEKLILTAQDDPGSLPDVLGELDGRTADAPVAFWARLAQRLGDLEGQAPLIGDWLESRLKGRGFDLERAAIEEQQAQASDQVSIANSVSSIRWLDAADWNTFFESVSAVERILRLDPAGVYKHMAFASRDRYRHAVEVLAERSTYAETAVSELVVGMSEAALVTDPANEAKGHVGWWLMSGGRLEFEKRIGYRPTNRERLYRGVLLESGLTFWIFLLLTTVVLIAALTALAVLGGASTWQIVLLVGSALVPAGDLGLAVANRLSALIYPPKVLPKLDYTAPVSDSHRTIVVVPALLSSVGAAQDVLENLEVTYLANRDPNIAFGLVGDLKAADTQTLPTDAEIIEASEIGVSRLNDRYEAEHGVRPFYLFVRARTYNEGERGWMGWERKRGALLELARFLTGEGETTFAYVDGDMQFLRSVAFVLTLDSDTILPRDGARRLISTIAHPLNRARLNSRDPRVKRGYGLVQPRVSMTITGVSRSPFAQMYSGPTGIDPYATAASDTYQDVFSEGSFTGKGIFEVAVFETVLEGRFPENSLLSHDLIEGSLLRTALASDIEVLDHYPSNYLTASWRLHRWVRGDWQTLPWLAAAVRDQHGAWTPNPLNSISRWKIVDNLRRSLAAPTTFLLFTLGWALLPGPALWWPLVGLLVVFFPAYFSLADSILFRPKSVSFASSAPSLLSDFALDTQRGAFALAMLPHQAWLMLDAIVRALWRMMVTRRGLLEWETAADAEARAGTRPRAFWRVMGVQSVLGAVLVIGAAVLEPVRLVVAAPFGILWVTAPWIAWWASMPRPVREPVPLTDEDRAFLRRTTRKTWRFYDTFVTSEGHYLAPDNFQEDPKGEIAWRTSPTNVGLQLMAYLNAYDLGYVSLVSLVERTSATLATLAGLERWRGHFFNWYDIRTLDPLRPNYISTVDSGNLAGHLLVLRMGLLEASESPLLGPQILPGIRDTVHLALEDVVLEREQLGPTDSVRELRDALEELARTASLTEPPHELGGWVAVLQRLDAMAAEADAALSRISGTEQPATPGEPRPWPSMPLERVRSSVADAVRSVRGPLVLLGALAPWAPLVGEAPLNARAHHELSPLLSAVPSLVGLAEGLDIALATLDTLAEGADGALAEWSAAVADGIRGARPQASELLARLRLDADIAREMWEHTDFRLLYDEQRKLFSIGLNLAEGRLDPSYYDLLASECRLGSYLAVAKGDIPQEHWFRLGRPLTQTSCGRGLVSWSASMFEYLMPLLVMEDVENSLLGATYRTVVCTQIEYAAQRGVPWGVSESAFNAKDAELIYQYQAFGVPGLGLKRGLSEDVVVAPYACVLALPIEPSSVVGNLRALSEEGAEGRWGYFEAIDYTPGRVPAGKTRAIVKSYFAHHQGMVFVAIGNQLFEGKMRDRFHADPIVASADLLLQERVPRHPELVSPHVEEVRFVRSVRELPPPVTRSYPTAETPVPATHFLSNGRYSVMVTNSGGGYSRWRDVAVTRYREDVTRDWWGSFFFIRDVDTGEVFSAPHNPHKKRPDDYHVIFAPDKAEFRRTDGTLETSVEVAVSPEDDVEVRRIVIANHGRQVRRIEVTSYFEIALADQRADQAHKSFSNLFVETEVLADSKAILFTRRPRSSEEERAWGLHLAACEIEDCDWSFETDRAAFVGRTRLIDDPACLKSDGPLGRSQGAVLDPCAAIRIPVEIQPGETSRMVFATGIADDRESAIRLCEKYRDPRGAQRAVDLAWTAAQLELRDLGINPSEAIVFERLASRLLLTDPYSPLKTKTSVENGLPISGLWSIGISGDKPILLVTVKELEHTPLVRQALLAHQYWRHKGLSADLVVVNMRPSGYSDELEGRLRLLVRTGHALQLLDKPGGVFLRQCDHMHPDVWTLLQSVARARLDGEAGTIELQLSVQGKRPEEPDALIPTEGPRDDTSPPFVRPELKYDNGLGGFDAETGDYVIVLEDERATPAPWINVMASRDFGAMVSEAGVGTTWALNSHENRITTWNNDPVSDGSGEALYLRDEDSGEFWSPTPLPARDGEPYVVRHGKGVTRFEHTSHGIRQELDWFVSMRHPVRIVRLRVTNLTKRRRRIYATQFVEWVLGSSRSKSQQVVVTWYDEDSEILTAHNHYNIDFPGRSAFVACTMPLHSFTASRKEFIGRNRAPSDPAAMHRKGLGGICGRYHDNCGALMTPLVVEAGESAEVSFLLGQTGELDEARDIVRRLREPGAIDAELEHATGFWRDLLGTVEVSTPDPRLDLLVNGNLLYQATACRLWGRTATYQSSGAFGFRDQLQDVMALLLSRPELVREQILEASRHQFPEGDVQHWWQPYSGRGVRTHITDDRHWLPLVVAEYIEATGDVSVLDEMTPFIEGPPLPLEQEDLYIQPVQGEPASVYEHCLRAVETGRPVGEHGLPLMGGGDWNDGMNRVGREGRGESVWLAWFLAYVLDRFAPICEFKGEAERAEEFRQWSDRLAEAVERTSWDGAWYRRAYFDDGTPLGTRAAEEARIDAIAQAWAVISGKGDPERAQEALDSVEEKLVRREDGLIALLTPPFDKMEEDPGYIKGYVPGVRENGGQYTHAALWVALASLLLGDGDAGVSLLQLINPVMHGSTPEDVERYKVEPYVVAADVYSTPPHVGRGGWTWYTGSAAWFYRVLVTWLLGLKLTHSDGVPLLRIDPTIPKSWQSFDMTYRRGRTTWRIVVNNPRDVNTGVARVVLDGEEMADLIVPLHDDGFEHEVVVWMLGG
ncbi:MAG: hypothetical protein HY876_04625 [Coriobacteriales bacterium]|nr:hypothetical protein [Coriobacteriales bacterium]